RDQSYYLLEELNPVATAEVVDITGAGVPLFEEPLQPSRMAQDELLATLRTGYVLVWNSTRQVHELARRHLEGVGAAGHHVAAAQHVKRLIHFCVPVQRRAVARRDRAVQQGKALAGVCGSGEHMTACGGDAA